MGRHVEFVMGNLVSYIQNLNLSVFVMILKVLLILMLSYKESQPVWDTDWYPFRNSSVFVLIYVWFLFVCFFILKDICMKARSPLAAWVVGPQGVERRCPSCRPQPLPQDLAPLIPESAWVLPARELRSGLSPCSCLGAPCTSALHFPKSDTSATLFSPLLSVCPRGIILSHFLAPVLAGLWKAV